MDQKLKKKQQKKLMTIHKALHPRDDYMYQVKKEKEDKPAVKITSMHRYDYKKTT